MIKCKKRSFRYLYPFKKGESFFPSGIFLLSLCLPLFQAFGQHYPPLSLKPDTAAFAPYVVRTANLLTSSSAKDPQQVRILVYGQSISEQKWWKEVKAFMVQRYPSAEITMINKAIGGFSADRLKLMAENDVLSFYPDLILFHDYGGEQDYEQILRTIRSKTTAEVVLQTDHIGVGQSMEWHDKHAEVTLPTLAEKYGLALIDVRAAWKDYLAANNLEPAALLSDHVHLNDHGNYLMAEIIKKYWQALPAPNSMQKNSLVKVLRPGKDFKLNKKTISMLVEGNRVDLVWNPLVKKLNPVEVFIDGEKPSSLEGCYYTTRPVLQPDGAFFSRVGSLLTVKLGDSAQQEEWRLTITEVDSVQQQVRFKLWGSQSGDEGTGSSETLFTSRSGKIIIEPNQWFRRRNPGDFSQFPWIKAGDTFSWMVKSMCQDVVKPEAGARVTVVQGIPNEAHQLKLSGRSLKGLREIIIYEPPVEK